MNLTQAEALAALESGKRVRRLDSLQEYAMMPDGTIIDVAEPDLVSWLPRKCKFEIVEVTDV